MLHNIGRSLGRAKNHKSGHTESDRRLGKASLSKWCLSKCLNEMSKPFEHAGAELPKQRKPQLQRFFDGVVLDMARAASSYPPPHSKSCPPPEKFSCVDGPSITAHSQCPVLWLNICLHSSPLQPLTPFADAHTVLRKVTWISIS